MTVLENIRLVETGEDNFSEYRHAQISGVTVLVGAFPFEKVSSNSFYFSVAKKFASRQESITRSVYLTHDCVLRL